MEKNIKIIVNEKLLRYKFNDKKTPINEIILKELEFLNIVGIEIVSIEDAIDFDKYADELADRF